MGKYSGLSRFAPRGAAAVANQRAWSLAAGSLVAAVTLMLACLVLTPESRATYPPGANGKIAFTSTRNGYFEIYVMRADGTAQTQLTKGSEDDNPAWSPDGGTIAFSRCQSGSCGIFAMNPDGSGQRRLTAPSINPYYESYAQPAWSPDGGKLAFARCLHGRCGIYVMSIDSAEQIKLADGHHPSWSPDGGKIAYDNNGALVVMNADGSNKTTLPGNGSQLAWSPDGGKIAFTSSTDGKWDVWVMNADGSDSRRLTNHPADDFHPSQPAWSADGSMIIYSRGKGGGNANIWIMNANGSGQRRLTNTANGRSDLSPDWQRLPDTTPPAVTNVRPTGTIRGNSTTVSAEYTDSESGVDTASIVVTLDGETLSGCTVSATQVSCQAGGLAPGHHTISGSVADRAGNSAAISGGFDVRQPGILSGGLIGNLLQKVLGLVFGNTGSI